MKDIEKYHAKLEQYASLVEKGESAIISSKSEDVFLREFIHSFKDWVTGKPSLKVLGYRETSAGREYIYEK